MSLKESGGKALRDRDDSGVEPVLSVLCHTFNHAGYIAETIEGFLSQVVDFPCEIIIHDDASTDGTADIVRDYERRFPGIVKSICQTVNQYSQGKRPIRLTLSAAQGRYIAMCEGDDVWVDSSKLQKQVSFLEDNPEYVVCYHDAEVFDENGVIKDSKMPLSRRRDHSKQELQRGAWLLTLTLCYRKVFDDVPDEHMKVINGDRFLVSLLGHHGAGKYLGNIEPARYRVHGGGVWSSKHRQQRVIEHVVTYYWMSEYYQRIENIPLGHYFRMKSARMLIKGAPRLLGFSSYSLNVVWRILAGRRN